MIGPLDDIRCSTPSVSQAEPLLGNAVPLRRVPIGTDVHNVELKPGNGARLVRAAGCSGTVVGRSEDELYTLVQFPSGEVRRVHSRCQAVIGQVSNPLHKLRILGKAGAKRWLGRRPKVRGVAMSPPDHPHAGGRKGSPAMPSRSRTGVFAKGGFRTRRYDRNRLNWIVTSRHGERRRGFDCCECCECFGVSLHRVFVVMAAPQPHRGAEEDSWILSGEIELCRCPRLCAPSWCTWSIIDRAWHGPCHTGSRS